MEGGLEALKRELRRNAEQKAQQELERAEAEAAAITAEARKQARQIVGRGLEEAQALAEEEGRKTSSARLRARKISAEALEGGISKALAELLKQLTASAGPRNSAKSGYAKLFQKLGKTALAELEGGVIRCRKQDLPMARKLGRVGEPISCAGGLVVESQDGRIRVDATFEALVEEHRDELKKKAFELLYGKKA